MIHYRVEKNWTQILFPTWSVWDKQCNIFSDICHCWWWECDCGCLLSPVFDLWAILRGPLLVMWENLFTQIEKLCQDGYCYCLSGVICLSCMCPVVKKNAVLSQMMWSGRQKLKTVHCSLSSASFRYNVLHKLADQLACKLLFKRYIIQVFKIWNAFLHTYDPSGFILLS